MWSYRKEPRRRSRPENTGPEEGPGPGTPEETQPEGVRFVIEVHNESKYTTRGKKKAGLQQSK